MATKTLKSCQVAVIGAGPAGLVTARELRREGHKVTVFERQNKVGGTWVYSSEAESDPMSIDPNRNVIHSSVYESLRMNFCREVMGYGDYPFIAKKDDITVDPNKYPCHREVFQYLQDFAKEFNIEELVRLETEVVYVGLVDDTNITKWKVRSRNKIGNDGQFKIDEEIYDAVVVCNGHYFEPRIADIPGMNSWPGKQMHSHNYRVPEPFQDQVVIFIGHSISSKEISKEVAGVAKEVHIASRSVADETYEKQPGYDNMWLHSMIESIHEDGSVVFRNGRVVRAHFILHCTGYKYHFPFLDIHDTVTVDRDGNRVGPLYKHVFPPALAPGLSFVGIPIK
ncbi:flavin-containing monooxygenase FMO GS-OX-like 3 isoform X2 [Mercurialis annua]|nr:flavin-containing monooxygenase FMO GS-OX-like 3 isoform X2 [Mercurialis annua]